VDIQIIVSRAGTEGSTVSSLICYCANAEFRDAQYYSLLESLITDGVLLHALVGH